MDEPLAFLNGQFLPRGDLCVSVDDAGFMLGVTTAEQLRTFAGKLFRLEQHLERLFRGLSFIGVEIPYSLNDLAGFAQWLVETNHRLLPAGEDLGLTIFVTPGPYAPVENRGPVVAMHTRLLATHTFARLYTGGQNLVTTSVRQIPAECWPPELKCRSRMHYWLADREARRIDPTARALLLDHDGYVTEASTANIVTYFRNEGLISPPLDSILHGISLAVLMELAAGLGIPTRQRRLRPDDLLVADEVLMCSTSPCVWPVLSFNGQTLSDGRPGDIFRRLIAAWSELVGIPLIAS
jgi:branched-subunit amino acid aminotransferase/4-amino-4-deoxychorismate lyase